jgi:hypothetical protein
MKQLLTILATVALALTIVPAFLHWGGVIDLSMVKGLMFGSLILWFAAVLPLQKCSVRPK